MTDTYPTKCALTPHKTGRTHQELWFGMYTTNFAEKSATGIHRDNGYLKILAY